MMSKSERRAQLDKQVGICPIEGSMPCQHISYQAAHLTAVHQGCRCKGLQSAPELSYSAILLLDYSDSCASVQSHLAAEKLESSGHSDSACPAAQVKDLEMQQDGIQRAIETKQQQLKPLEAEVRGRSRQGTDISAWSFLPPGFELEVAPCTLWHVMGVLYLQNSQSAIAATVLRQDCKPFMCDKATANALQRAGGP